MIPVIEHRNTAADGVFEPKHRLLPAKRFGQEHGVDDVDYAVRRIQIPLQDQGVVKRRLAGKGLRAVKGPFRREVRMSPGESPLITRLRSIESDRFFVGSGRS
jgi:hypothetical protein